MGFLLALNDAVRGKALSDPCPASSAVEALVEARAGPPAVLHCSQALPLPLNQSQLLSLYTLAGQYRPGRASLGLFLSSLGHEVRFCAAAEVQCRAEQGVGRHENGQLLWFCKRNANIHMAHVAGS